MVKEEIKYKETGIEWVPTIPSQWEMRRIKTLFTFRKEIVGEDSSQYKVLSLTVQRDGIIERDIESGMGKFPATFDGYQKIEPNSIVLCLFDMDVTPRIVGFSELTGMISAAYTNIVPKEKVYPKFYYYYFLNQDRDKSLYALGKGIRITLREDNFGSLFAPYPSYEEQKAIVEYLDAQIEKINLFIQKKQRFIELLKEQRQSKIDEAVDGTNKNWFNKKLKYIAEIKFSNVDKHTIEDEIPVRLCNYVDVYKNDYITNDLEFMNATATETEIEKFTVLKGDVIITKDSEEATDIAVPTFVKEDLENVVCGYHLALIRANENEILNEYLFRKFQSSELKAYFAIEATGVTRVGLSMGEITGVKISYPKSIEEQKQIVSHIKTETATIDTAIAKAEREIELIREYKEAMIAEAVMGKIL
ncbi:MAG: restriction endonuclease subunit S [Lewinellaceae bacterium]|nr:restriction endonuclease subunit S [Lewinellaceae bacterium]